MPRFSTPPYDFMVWCLINEVERKRYLYLLNYDLFKNVISKLNYIPSSNGRMVSSHLCLRLARSGFLWGSIIHFSFLACVLHVSPSHPSRFDYYDYISGGVQFMNPLIMHLPPFSCYFLSPKSVILLSTLFPNTIYSLLFAESERPSCTPIQASISDMFYF
jgi:hypothetical protein